MDVSLPWGEKELALTLPDGWTVFQPQRPPLPPEAHKDELTLVAEALAAPVGARPLRERDLAGKRILVIIDDNTRPTPVARFLHLALAELERAGVERRNITLLAALGIHTPMTEAEMAEKVGAENLAGLQWRNHDAFDENQMTDFGVTRRGTRVRLNKALAEADLILTLGLIEPHLWAGFGGGMKNILPGVAAAETIGQHHHVIAEPPYQFNRVGMAPEENDFRLDLEEVQGLIAAPIFALNVVLSPGARIIAAFAGDPVAAHRAGVAFNRRISGLSLPQQVDGVIVNSHPMDINLKQSMKGVGNSLPALKPGGVVMGFLRAERGLDDIPLPEKATPLWLTKNILRLLGPSRVLWFLDKVRPGQNVEERFLTYYSMQLIRAHDLYFYVPSLSDDEVKRLGFFQQFHDPQQVIQQGLKKLGPKAAVALFPEAGATFPIIDAARSISG